MVTPNPGSLLTTSKHKPDLPNPDDLSITSQVTHEVWLAHEIPRDSREMLKSVDGSFSDGRSHLLKRWYLKSGPLLKAELNGYELADFFGVHTPTRGLMKNTSILTPARQQVDWSQFLKQADPAGRILVTRDVTQMSAADLCIDRGTGIEAYLLFCSFGGSSDIGIGNNTHIISERDEEFIVVYDPTSASYLGGERPSFTDDHLLIRNWKTISSKKFISIIERVESVGSTTLSSSARALGIAEEFIDEEAISSRIKGFRMLFSTALGEALTGDGLKMLPMSEPQTSQVSNRSLYNALFPEYSLNQLQNCFWDALIVAVNKPTNLDGEVYTPTNDEKTKFLIPTLQLLDMRKEELQKFALEENPFIDRSINCLYKIVSKALVELSRKPLGFPDHLLRIRQAIYESGAPLLARIENALTNLKGLDPEQSALFKKIRGIQGDLHK